MSTDPAAGLPDAEPAGEFVPAGVREMGIDDAFQLAVRLHQQERYEGAHTLYQRILAAVPDHADAMGLLGMLKHQLGRSDEGLALIRAAIERVPGFVGFHINLGNVLVETNRLDEALAAYHRAAELAPGSADTHSNIGAVYRALGRFDEARASYERAIGLDGRHIRAWNNLGLLHDAQGRLEDAMRAYLTAIDLVPDSNMSAYLLGMTFYKLGQIPKAAEVFRQWMLRDPSDPVPAHLYTACSGQAMPERASDDYIEASFDNFAASFEQVLNEKLHYRAPQLACDLLAAHLPAPARALDVLDAGCGTGLCGPLVAPWARRLVGVDLSAGMLAKARQKGTYNELCKAELTGFLLQGPASWQAIVCADTLCYFGDLSKVMQAACAALVPGGTMVFTVEALADDLAGQPALLPHGRYAHGRAHLDHVLAAVGLVTLDARREVLRNEAGAPVNGWLMAVRRPMPAAAS
jgi:predicted TPR repeat methyltransferase